MKEEEKTNDDVKKMPIESEILRSDSFLKMAEELTNASSKHLFQKEQLSESLKEGYDALDKKKYRRAIDCYKEALKISSVTPLNSLGISSKDVAIINYVLNLARVESSNYEKIVQAIRDMEDNQHLTAAVPAFSYLLGKAYYKLNRFKQALEPLQKCEEILQNQFPFASKFWPSTDKIIKETTREGLEECVMELIHLCSACPEKPTAVCRYDKCLEISTHIVPSEQIHISDPDFIGYISLTCEGKCNIHYHIHCWKAFKETFSSVEKVHDKDMLDRACPTTDCVSSSGEQSKICLIEIIGQDGKVKTQIKSEISQKQIMSKNLKKRKQKLSEKEDKPTEKVAQPRQKSAKTKHEKIKSSVDISSASGVASSASGDNITASESVEEMKKRRLVVLEQLRAINFGCVEENLWNYCKPYYGREDEKEKKEKQIFISPELCDDDATHHYKEYVMSWFYEVLSKEGPMKVDEIQEQWTSNCSGSDSLFTDVKSVLADVTNICDLLLDSTRFCVIDDYLCLSEQLPEAYNESKTELTELLLFILSESASQESSVQTKSSLPANISNDKGGSTATEEATVKRAQQLVEQDNLEVYVSDTESESSGDYASDLVDEDEDEDDDGCKSEEENVVLEEGGTEDAGDSKKTEVEKDNIGPSDRMEETQVPQQDVKSFTSISIQTDENIEKYMTNIQELQITLDSLKTDLGSLKKQAVKNEQIIKKMESEKKKLADEKEKLVLKYESQIAKKETNFKKEKEKLVAERDRLVDRLGKVNKEVEKFGEFSKQTEAKLVKMGSQMLEEITKKQLAMSNLLDLQFKYCNLQFEMSESRRRLKLSELEYLSSLDYLPSRSKILTLIKEWNNYNDKMSKCRIEFNLNYDKIKRSLSSGEEVNLDSLFIEMTRIGIVEPEPPCLSIEVIVNELLEYNKKNNISIASQTDAVSTDSYVPDSGQCNPALGVSRFDQNINQPSTSAVIKDSCKLQESCSEMSSSESDDELKNNNSSRAFEFLKNKNNEKSILSDNKKQKSSQRSDSTKSKNSTTPKKVDQLLLSSTSDLQKKVKKGKVKVPQLSSSSLVVGSTLTDSIWGPITNTQQNWPSESVTDYAGHNNNGRDGDGEGEWQVIVDKRTMKEQSSSVIPMLSSGPKNIKSSYVQLIERLKKTYPNKTEKELSASVKVVRERNNGSLTGLSIDEIEFRVGKLFQEKAPKKSVSMGLEKFGETAWGGGVVSSNSNWQFSSDMMDECVICCEDMGSINLTTLECNHPFHTECIRQWLKEKSVCPLCNKFTKMPDEFPAL